MVLKLEDKKAIVAEVSAVAAASLSIVAADYQKLTVGDLNKLRKNGRSMGVCVRVVRNTLARRAVEGTSFEYIKENFVGSLILGFSKEEPGAAARLFRDFSKTVEGVDVKFIAISGRVFGQEGLETVAKLPTRNEAIALFMGLLNQPVTLLARTLSEPAGTLVRALAAVGNQQNAA